MRKTADVTPLPKKKPVQLLEKDLRPISLPPAVSCLLTLFRLGFFRQSVTGGGLLGPPPLYLWNQ